MSNVYFFFPPSAYRRFYVFELTGNQDWMVCTQKDTWTQYVLYIFIKLYPLLIASGCLCKGENFNEVYSFTDLGNGYIFIQQSWPSKLLHIYSGQR